MLDVSGTASFETTLVRLPLTKFSQDYIIGFFLIFYMMIADRDIYWLTKSYFWKKLGQNLFFDHFLELRSYVLLEIAYNDSL